MMGYERSVAEHERLRPIRMALNSKLLKHVSRKALEKAGRKLGILIDGVFCFETEDESSVLVDYCIHEQRDLGKNVVDRFLLRRDLSEDERNILESMHRCWFSLCEIEGTVPGAGVEARDLLREQQLFIIDVNLSHCDVGGGILAARLMPFDAHFISTGTALPVDADTLECIVDEMEHCHFYRHLIETWSARERAEVAAIIVRTCLAHGSSRHIRYA